MKTKRSLALILALAAFFTLSSGNAWLAPAAEAQNEDSSEMTWSASFTDVVLPEGLEYLQLSTLTENGFYATSSEEVPGSGENGTEHGRRAGGTLKTPEPEHTAGICRQEIRETAGEPERIHGWSGGDGAHPAFRTAAGAKLRNKRARSAAQYAAGFVCHGRNCPQGQRDLRHTGRKCSATTQEGSRACNPTSLFQYLYDILQGTLINGSPLLACFFL